MSKIFLYIFLFSSICYSQENKDLSLVTYTFEVNLYNYTDGIPYKSRLFYNDSTSLFIYNNMYIEGVTGFLKKSWR